VGALITNSIPGFFAGWVIGLFIMYVRWERMKFSKILLVSGILLIVVAIFGVWFTLLQRIGAGIFGGFLIFLSIELEYG